MSTPHLQQIPIYSRAKVGAVSGQHNVKHCRGAPSDRVDDKRSRIGPPYAVFATSCAWTSFSARRTASWFWTS